MFGRDNNNYRMWKAAFVAGIGFGCAIVLLWLAVTLVPASPAAAQTACGLRSKVILRLRTKYLEAPRHIASVGKGRMVKILEVLVAKDGGFSIITTDRFGLTCMFVVGNNWEDVPWELGTKL